jgi:hypothetical protein
MGVDYGWEKFFSSLHFAIGSTHSLQERLHSVMSGVSHLDRDSFPDDERWERFEKLLKETTKLPARFEGEGTIQATTEQMSDDDAAKWLREAFGLFSDIALAYGKVGH